MDPLGTIETAIEARLDRIKTAAKWTKEFVVSRYNFKEIHGSSQFSSFGRHFLLATFLLSYILTLLLYEACVRQLTD